MRVNFLENKAFSKNGYDVIKRQKGESDELPEHMAKAFVDQGICEVEGKKEVKAEEKSTEAPKKTTRKKRAPKKSK